jgi:hypothetical protein
MVNHVNCIRQCLRSGDDDFCVDKVLVKLRVGSLLAGGCHELVTLVLEPLADSELVLSGTEHLGLVSGVLVALELG